MILSEKYGTRKQKLVDVEKITLPEMNNKTSLTLASCLPVVKHLDMLSEASRCTFLYQHPPIVCEQNNGTFTVVGNLRALEIARSLTSRKIPCIVISCQNQHHQLELLLFNELMNLIFYSLDARIGEHRILQLRQAIHVMNPDCLEQISYTFTVKTKFCDFLGINRRTKS